ncbi:hypothetical protein MKX01_040620 [Papaver californicum]|nr:hypothetical protein MKX01_040620 [Papaver californicum]
MNCESLKDVPASDQLGPEVSSLFAEGICLILSHWVTLAIEVAEQIDERQVKSVGYLIQETVRSGFKCSVGDGSTILVSTKLKMLHQELLHGNLESIEGLRQSTSWIGQGTFDRLKKEEREVRRLQKRRLLMKMTKQPKKSSIVKEMKTRKRHHPERLQLQLSALNIFGIANWVPTYKLMIMDVFKSRQGAFE